MPTTITNYDGSISHHPAAGRPAEDRRGDPGDPVGSRTSFRVRCGRWGASLAHAVRVVYRHHRRHDGDEEGREDRSPGDDVHRPGRARDDRGGNRMLREQKLQFMLNIEIGNLTLGSAACCHTKDSLDGVEFGQVNSYVTGVKWVSPSGELAGGVAHDESGAAAASFAAATDWPASSTRSRSASSRSRSSSSTTRSTRPRT